MTILTFRHIQCLRLMYAEVAWVLVSSGTQVQPRVILDPDYLPDYLSVSYDYAYAHYFLGLKGTYKIYMNKSKCTNWYLAIFWRSISFKFKNFKSKIFLFFYEELEVWQHWGISFFLVKFNKKRTFVQLRKVHGIHGIARLHYHHDLTSVKPKMSLAIAWLKNNFAKF